MLGWMSTSSEKPRINHLTFFLARIPASEHLSFHHKTKIFETKRVPPYFFLCISLFIFLALSYSLWIVSGWVPYYMVDFINTLEILQCHQIFCNTHIFSICLKFVCCEPAQVWEYCHKPFLTCSFRGFHQGVDAHMLLFFSFLVVREQGIKEATEYFKVSTDRWIKGN